jgi:hypothetical protein
MTNKSDKPSDKPVTRVHDENGRNPCAAMVVCAVRYEPVSKAKFPVIREFNREFCDFGPSGANFVAGSPSAAATSRVIPYGRKQGFCRG